jgi:hypothetical protein
LIALVNRSNCKWKTKRQQGTLSWNAIENYSNPKRLRPIARKEITKRQSTDQLAVYVESINEWMVRVNLSMNEWNPSSDKKSNLMSIRERERGASGRNYFWNAADAETAGVGVRMEKNDSQNPTI